VATGRETRVFLTLALAVASPVITLGQTTLRDRDEQRRIEFFEKKIRPVLVENCYNCHSANTNSRGGLRVDDRNGLILGGDHGPAVVPGDPDKSLLIQAVRQTHAEVKMPPKKHLADEQIADLMQWIKDGAAWPKAAVPVLSGEFNGRYEQLRAEHWAWQPIRKHETPAGKNESWVRDDIDRFILAGLEAKGLQPVADADPATFIRRVTFDLTGLPPTTSEIADFELRIAELKSPQSEIRIPQSATEELVDRLLASPAFGERWGRHWLDVARYGESTGSARNVAYPHAWRYRDYVINAFNSDKPYDRFLREQIAGDLLPAELESQRDEQSIATGFLAIGVCDVNQRFKVRFVMDNIDEQIDTVSRAVLGLTASCARCHDHKFDPIPIIDYYALAGIFHSSDRCAAVRNKMGGGGMDYYDTAMLLRLGSTAELDAGVAEQIEQSKTELAQARAGALALQENVDENPPGPEREQRLAAARKQVEAAQAKLIALSDPATRGPVAMGVRDGRTIGDTEIRIRGEAENLGPVVPRGFLSVFDVPNSAKINAAQSGRLELADWLASPHNPLTARVMANRIWQHLFGQGLVISVDNFGVTGDAPSHPELLDHLATRFIAGGWSVKKLVRSIVLSRAYQLSSDAPASQLTVDPANRLIWRHGPRRMDAEEIRDAMLAASGELDLNRPAGSPAQNLKVMELRNDGPEAKRLAEYSLASKHRSLYLPQLRGLTPRSLEVFDFAEQGMVTGSRDTTTVATQALYLLNDPFVRQQAAALSARLLGASELDDAGRIALAYRLTLGRSATVQETERTKNYITEYAAASRNEGEEPAAALSAAWSSLCQAILASAEFRYLR